MKNKKKLPKSWRKLNKKILFTFVKETNVSLIKRIREGTKKYDSLNKGFQTEDILDEIEQELLDALFYVFMAKKEREFLKEEFFEEKTDDNK